LSRTGGPLLSQLFFHHPDAAVNAQKKAKMLVAASLAAKGQKRHLKANQQSTNAFWHWSW